MNPFNAHADEYDRWFDRNEPVYQAEILALKRLVPPTGLGLEIGMGSGRFSTPFGITIGVEPARAMAQIAKSRNLSVCQAVGEHLPFGDARFDFILTVTVLCFVKSIPRLLSEARRVLKLGGRIVIAFIDRESELGQIYESHKASDKFFKSAHFYSAPEVSEYVQKAGFDDIAFTQTILGVPGDDPAVYEVLEGHGKGAFVVLSAEKISS